MSNKTKTVTMREKELMILLKTNEKKDDVLIDSLKKEEDLKTRN